MKNNTLHKVDKQINADRNFKGGSVCGFCLVLGLMASQEGRAQFSNKGDVMVQGNTILSIHEDYDNTSSGTFTNDGEVYIYKDWNNDGTVDFTDNKNGKTFFIGEQEQKISGQQTANFQSIVFDNVTSLEPFKLFAPISVNKQSEFANGIVVAVDTPGLVTFEKDAVHIKTSDLSFVDGRVEKIGNKSFEFPVGNQLAFRPSYHDATQNENNAYTTQYFYQNSDDIHSHSKKEEGIQLINNAEYWTVTKKDNSEDVILSLTLDPKTTPSEFFNVGINKKVVIVRWNGSKWISEGGAVRDRDNSDPISAATYTEVITAKVTGFGMFTLAIIDETPEQELIVYNAISPNDDGINDSFHIKGIDQYPDNTVEIYNRWGVKVYEAKGYNESDVMFRGYSDGRATINRNEKLPTGTYFYILKYNTGKQVKDKSGYLYINNQ